VNVTPEELLASIEGTASEEIRRKIVSELENSGSELRRALRALQALVKSATDVEGFNWAAYAEDPVARAGAERAVREQVRPAGAGEMTPAQPGGPRQPFVILLFARPRVRAGILRAPGPFDSVPSAASDIERWELLTPDGVREIPLPADLAACCYGERGDSPVSITLLLRATDAGSPPGHLRPIVEVSPAPARVPFSVVLSFPAGETRRLTVPVPLSPRQSTASAPGEPLPAAAFGFDGGSWKDWQIGVELGGEPGHPG
jgi:hypothetical protein